MKSLALFNISLAFLIRSVLSNPIITHRNPPHPQALRRDIPPIPDRPEGMNPNTFHDNQFIYFDDIGFVNGSPAVEAAPVWLFSRTNDDYDPCYPESAVKIGSDPKEPNPGTDGPEGTASINPGADCTNPGDRPHEMSLGNDFPVYASSAWCPGDGGDVWKVNYDVYYVHDGNLEAGHKHEWEGITVVFAKDPASKDGDAWWYRAGAQYNHHSAHDWFNWSDLITVDVDNTGDVNTGNVGSTEAGKNLKHPKAYVGFFSHSAYDRADTSVVTYAGIASTEYRNDDWWKLPHAGDIWSYKEIDRKYCTPLQHHALFKQTSILPLSPTREFRVQHHGTTAAQIARRLRINRICVDGPLALYELCRVEEASKARYSGLEGTGLWSFPDLGALHRALAFLNLLHIIGNASTGLLGPSTVKTYHRCQGNRFSLCFISQLARRFFAFAQPLNRRT